METIGITRIWGFSKIRGPILEVPIMRIIDY